MRLSKVSGIAIFVSIEQKAAFRSQTDLTVTEESKTFWTSVIIQPVSLETWPSRYTPLEKGRIFLNFDMGSRVNFFVYLRLTLVDWVKI